MVKSAKENPKLTSVGVVWTRPPRASRGPHPAHSVSGIAEVAIRIADKEGIAAVSIRRIAAELGSGAASLYRYIKNKDELLDLMVDAIIAEQEIPPVSGSWRRDLRNIAYCARLVALHHPWLADLPAFRSSFGPDSLRWLEFSLQAMNDLGLDIDEMLVMTHALFAFVRGHMSGEIAEQEVGSASSMSADEWIAQRGHYTMNLLESGEFPMFSRVVRDAKGPHDPAMAEKAFSQSLDYILDGFAARIAKSQP